MSEAFPKETFRQWLKYGDNPKAEEAWEMICNFANQNPDYRGLDALGPEAVEHLKGLVTTYIGLKPADIPQKKEIYRQASEIFETL